MSIAPPVIKTQCRVMPTFKALKTNIKWPSKNVQHTTFFLAVQILVLSCKKVKKKKKNPTKTGNTKK